MKNSGENRRIWFIAKNKQKGCKTSAQTNKLVSCDLQIKLWTSLQSPTTESVINAECSCWCGYIMSKTDHIRNYWERHKQKQCQLSNIPVTLESGQVSQTSMEVCYSSVAPIITGKSLKDLAYTTVWQMLTKQLTGQLSSWKTQPPSPNITHFEAGALGLGLGAASESSSSVPYL